MIPTLKVYIDVGWAFQLCQYEAILHMFVFIFQAQKQKHMQPAWVVHALYEGLHRWIVWKLNLNHHPVW